MHLSKVHWQSRGHGFDSHILHPEDQRVTMSKIVTLFFSARNEPRLRQGEFHGPGKQDKTNCIVLLEIRTLTNIFTNEFCQEMQLSWPERPDGNREGHRFDSNIIHLIINGLQYKIVTP